MKGVTAQQLMVTSSWPRPSEFDNHIWNEFSFVMKEVDMCHSNGTQAVKEQRLSGGDWRRADGTDEHENTSICVYMLLAGQAIKYKNQLCRITLC